MRLVLPSNSSMKNFPQNTLAQFTVQLPQPIDLSRGKWEIGLSEIQFFKSWYNVTGASITASKRGGRSETATLPDGYYETEQDIIDAMNKSIKCDFSPKLANSIEFAYSKLDRKLTVTLYPRRNTDLIMTVIEYSENLKQILNTETLATATKCNDDDEPHVYILRTSKPIRLNSIFNLMVYTDVATSNVVGDIEAPLLRAVPIEDGHWKYQSTTFSKIQYIPISQKELRTITFYIYTDYGELVPFTDGRTVVTVDLRKADNLL